MSKNRFSWQAFENVPVIGILRDLSFDVIEKIAPIYRKAGLSTLEVTMNSKGATEIIREMVKRFPDLNIGAGTVCDPDDLEAAMEAGASYIVTPVLDEEVIKKAVDNNIPVFAGALTPTEIWRAWRAGASAVKIFPATQFGAGYLRDLSGPFKKIKLLPTGGVSIQNMESYFQAGAFGVGMGSTLFDKKMIRENELEKLSEHFRAVSIKSKKR
jgi:2-dehydro-3-deoxyphosphogluconate aldolase/(4S)-4-hydroxy-2-oxoglutarate aldolase